MLIKVPKASDCHESDVTPESLYLSRRSVLGAAVAGLAVSSLPRWASADDVARYADVEPGKAPSWFAEKASFYQMGGGQRQRRGDHTFQGCDPLQQFL